MKTRHSAIALIGLTSVSLAACSWLRDTAIDQATGIPVSGMISDVKKTSDDYEEEQHKERVEELNREYEEFLRSKDTAESGEENPQPPIVIEQ